MTVECDGHSIAFQRLQAGSQRAVANGELPLGIQGGALTLYHDHRAVIIRGLSACRVAQRNADSVRGVEPETIVAAPRGVAFALLG